MRNILIFSFMGVMMLSAGGVSARETNSFQVGLGGQFAFTTHDLCTREVDLVSCQTGAVGIGPQIFGYFHFANRLAVGVRGSFWQVLDGSRIVYSDGTEARNRLVLWRAAGAFRFYAVQKRVTHWWLDWEIGVAGASNSYIEGALDARRIHQMGFALGMGTGFDFIIKERWVLGFELRALLLVFGNAPQSVDDAIATELGTALWPAVGFVHLGYKF